MFSRLNTGLFNSGGDCSASWTNRRPVSARHLRRVSFSAAHTPLQPSRLPSLAK